MAKILLNWLPPSMESMPSPAHSVLKQTLEGLGHNVNIEYWNIKLCPILESFLNLGNEIYKRELVKFIPFYAYLGIEYKQNALLNPLIDNILYLKPQLQGSSAKYIKTLSPESIRPVYGIYSGIRHLCITALTHIRQPIALRKCSRDGGGS